MPRRSKFAISDGKVTKSREKTKSFVFLPRRGKFAIFDGKVTFKREKCKRNIVMKYTMSFFILQFKDSFLFFYLPLQFLLRRQKG